MAASVASSRPLSSAKDPSPALAAALSEGDLDAATACFARDACLITPSATAIRGREGIRPILAQLIEMGPSAEVEQTSTLVAGDVAIATESWTIRLGVAVTQRAESTAVLRRVEGAWKLQIAAPWGWG